MTTTERLTIETADGVTLEAELATVSEPVAAAVICHPHPLYGGNMHNNVVDALFRSLVASQVSCLRFNFRGAGGSSGSHGEGRAERIDVEAAIDHIADVNPGLPLVLAGYSFGGDVSLSITDPRIGGWLAVAPPLGVLGADELIAGQDERPKLIVTGSADDFRPPDQARAFTAEWAETEIRVAEGANHFFMTGLGAVRDGATELVDRLTG